MAKLGKRTMRKVKKGLFIAGSFSIKLKIRMIAT